ncbi:MAG: hypothetical protein ACE37B_16480 [Ilumatobacter sp.]|uniref:hypothetical protein n=1 Tax=Ilumatobacter sp. TaxID=1967498 RepID=UPI00391A67F0
MITLLTLSENAATLLSESRSQQGIPDDAVLRVAPAAGDDAGISLGFVERPLSGDHTATAYGLPLCVDPEVSEALDAAQIDVQTTDGSPSLVIVPAP